MIVGPVDWWSDVITRSDLPNVIYTGSIPPEQIGAYFNLIDLGVLPCEHSDFRDYAFPIKVLEYTTCRKWVVATPLETLRCLAWPNVLLVNRDRDAWVEALLWAKNARWRPEWDAIVEEYDWQRLAARLADWMDNPDHVESTSRSI